MFALVAWTAVARASDMAASASADAARSLERTRYLWASSQRALTEDGSPALSRVLLLATRAELPERATQHSCARCFCSQRIAEKCSAIGRDALRAYGWSRLQLEMSSPSKTRAPLLRVSGAAASVTCMRHVPRERMSWVAVTLTFSSEQYY